MKRLAMLLGMLLFFALPGLAADITFVWDPAPAGQTWTKVRLYERTGTTSPYGYALKGEVAGAATTITITGVAPGAHTYIARSYDGQWESADSNTASTGAVPTTPGNIRITVIVNVQVP